MAVSINITAQNCLPLSSIVSSLAAIANVHCNLSRKLCHNVLAVRPQERDANPSHNYFEPYVQQDPHSTRFVHELVARIREPNTLGPDLSSETFVNAIQDINSLGMGQEEFSLGRC
jgi:hypothetical protein